MVMVMLKSGNIKVLTRFVVLTLILFLSLVSETRSGNNYSYNYLTLNYFNKRNISDPFAISQNETKNNTQKPVELTCPEDISTYTDLNSCTSYISGALNAAYPGNSLTRLTWEMTGVTADASESTGINQINEYEFSEGITTVTYTAEDQNGNVTTCSFTVTISDNQVPRLLNIPGNITVQTAPGECSAPVFWRQPVAADNCTPASQIIIEGSVTPGSVFPVGTTTVNYHAYDAMGNESATQSFTVTVEDGEYPQLVLPDDIAIKCGEEVPSSWPNLQGLLAAGGFATDNCDIDETSFRLLSETSDGETCPRTITRTYEISDIHGNKTTAKQLVHVAAPSQQAQIPVLKSTQATVISTASGGNWNDGSSWEGGVVPQPGDDVEIAAGATITLTDNRTCKDITINGTLDIGGTNSLQINGSLTNNGSVSLGDGTISIQGDWTNNGTFTAGTGTIEFTGNGNSVISGNTTFNNLTLNKGSDVTSNLTVQSDITIGNLTFTNGVLDVNSGTTIISDIANADNTIPATSGLRISGGTLNTGYYSITNDGLIEVTSGTANFGTGPGNSVHTQIDGAFIVSGGNVNIAGRLENTAGGTLSGYPSGITVSGGTINLCTSGSGATGAASLMVSDYGAFNFTAGTINFINTNTNSTDPLDLDISIASGNGTKSITNGVFNFGDGSSNTYKISSAIDMPNITVAPSTDLESSRVITSTATPYTFYLSDGLGNIIHATITLNSGTIGSTNPYIEITTTDGKFTENKSSTNYLSRYWTVTVNDITNSNYTITVEYPSTDVSGTDSQIAGGVWSGSLPWVKGNPANAGANTISATGITTNTVQLTGITLADPTVTVTTTDAEICIGESTSLTANPNGDPDFSYAWNSIPPGYSSTSKTINNVTPSETTRYIVTLTDGNGFTANASQLITVNPLPIVSISSNTVCVGNTITLSPSTGGAWVSNNQAIATVSGSTVTGISNGNVNFTFTEAATGCSNTTSDITVNPLPTAIISYPDSPFCATATAAVTRTGQAGGTYSSTAGLSINPTTGEIDLAASTPNTYTITYDFSDANGCTNSTTASVTINDLPTATICYSGSPFCATATAAVTRTGQAGGTYSSTAGLSINPTTGEIDLAASTPNTYTVTYDFSDANGCTNSTTASVTINDLPTATISYPGSPFCATGTAAVSRTGQAGGTYSSTAGLSINPTTGEIDLAASTPNTYTVTYDFSDANGCTNSTTASVTINDLPTATISYPGSPFCATGTAAVSRTGQAGGTYSSTAGLSINPTTGEIDLAASTPNTYTVTYDFSDANGCTNSTTASVTINDLPTATISYPGSPFCATGTAAVSRTGQAGGTYSSTAGLSINPTTGEIDLAASTPNTYTVTYDFSDANGCTNSTTASVTINDLPTATISYPGSPFCATGTAAVSRTGQAGGTYSSTAGLSINPTTGEIDLAASTPNTYTVTYDFSDANGCTNSTTASVTINDLPTATISYPGSPFCATGTAAVSRTGQAGGTYSSTAGLSINPTTGEIDLAASTPNTYTVTYDFSDANGCTNSTTASVTIRPRPTSIISGTTSICTGNTAQISISFGLTGTGPFTYSINDGPVVTNTNNPEIITVNPTSTTTYTVTSLSNAHCSAEAADMTGSATITVNPLPELTSSVSETICSNETFSYTPAFADATSYTWSRAAVSGISNAPGMGTNIPINEVLVNTTSSPVDVVYEITMNNGCTAKEYLTVTVSPTAMFNVSADKIVGCYGDEFTISSSLGAVAGLTYSLTYVSGAYLVDPTFSDNTSGIFTIIPEPGKQTFRLTATNTNGCSYSQDITLKIFDVPDIDISPSCAEQSVTMSGTMLGTSSNPLNFTGSDIGHIEYSYNGGPWTTETYFELGTYGVVTVLAHNSAYPNCETSISTEISYTSVFAKGVSICQNEPSQELEALSLCVTWDDVPHVTRLNPPADQTYVVSSNEDTYVPGQTVAWTTTEIFKVDEVKQQFTFNDCNDQDYFSYSIYEYPFDPDHPERRFVQLIPVGAACPNITIPLDPDKYYIMVVNDYDINADVDVNFQFNRDDKALFIKKTTSEVEWHDEDGNLVGTGPLFDPVPSEIPNTSTPGTWKFYASCGTDENCREEVLYVIDPIPTGRAENYAETICSGEETDIRFTSIDENGDLIDPSIITYSWSAIISPNDGSVTISNDHCDANCGAIIRETIVNSGTSTATINFTMTVKVGDCLGEDFYYTLEVEPLPDFSINNPNDTLCPDNNTAIQPIEIISNNSPAIDGLTYEWRRNNITNLPVTDAGAVPESGTGAGTGFTIGGTLTSSIPNSYQTTQIIVDAAVNGNVCKSDTTYITIGDIEPPVITCPPEMSVSCEEEIPDPALDYDSFISLLPDPANWPTDNCTSPPTITFIDDVVISGNLCDGTIQRTYRATDNAGNYAECTQNIVIKDDTKPEFTSVPSTMVVCVYDIITAIYDGQPEQDADIIASYDPQYEPSPDVLNDRPDYYVLSDADKLLLSDVVYDDNCGVTLYWSLVDENNVPIRDLNSDTLEDQTDNISDHPIKLNGAQTERVTYHLIYRLIDTCGNESENPGIADIVVVPRPQITKLN